MPSEELNIYLYIYISFYIIHTVKAKKMKIFICGSEKNFIYLYC